MKKSWLFAAIVLCGSLFLFNSNIYAAENAGVDSTEASAAGPDFNISTDPSQIKLNVPVQNPSSSVQKNPSTVWLFIKMIFALAVVVGIAYGVFWLFKKNMKINNDSDPFLRKVSSITLAPGKSVQVVTLQDSAYLIGVSDENINLIGKVDDKQLVNAMNLYADKNQQVTKPKSFAEILEIFMPGSKNMPAENLYESEAENSADVIKSQRQRLNEENKEV